LNLFELSIKRHRCWWKLCLKKCHYFNRR